jgi:hypothetical protein
MLKTVQITYFEGEFVRLSCIIIIKSLHRNPRLSIIHQVVS